jgi:hypothetical protein
VYYKLQKPSQGTTLLFAKGGNFFIDGMPITLEKLQHYEEPKQLILCFRKDLSFGEYLQDKIFIRTLKLEGLNRNQEYIY